MSDLASIFLFALLAMLNPTLLAAVTVMLLLPRPKVLMAGYLLGAYITSISLGLVIVYSLHNSSAVSTSKHSLNPAEDLVLGCLALLIAFVLGTGRSEGFEKRRAEKKQAKEEAKKAAGKPTEALPMRLLGRGSPRITFVVGVLLSFPGVSMLTSLSHIVKLDPGPVPSALLVVAVCVIQLLLLEVPLLGYVFAPERTQETVDRFRAWLAANGRRALIRGMAVIGVLLIIRGVVTLL